MDCDSTHKPIPEKYFDLLDKAVAETALLQGQKYDGVVGVLPAWVPPFFLRIFEATRARLLSQKGVTASKAAQWIENFTDWDQDRQGASGFTGVRHIPRKFTADIETLYWIKKAVELEAAQAGSGRRYLLGAGPVGAIEAQEKARELGRASNTAKAASRRELARTTATELWKNDPSMKVIPTIADELRARHPAELGETKDSTFEKYLVGLSPRSTRS